MYGHVQINRMVTCAGYKRHVDELLSGGQRSKTVAKRDNSPLHVRGRRDKQKAIQVITESQTAARARKEGRMTGSLDRV